VLDLCPREDRSPERRVFAGFGGDRFRTAITRASTAAGVPAFSPHDLRHRRISLLHLGGVPWARIGEHVGQRNLAVTATRTPTFLSRRTSSTTRTCSPRLGHARLVPTPVPTRQRKTVISGGVRIPLGVSRSAHVRGTPKRGIELGCAERLSLESDLRSPTFPRR